VQQRVSRKRPRTTLHLGGLKEHDSRTSIEGIRAKLASGPLHIFKQGRSKGGEISRTSSWLYSRWPSNSHCLLRRIFGALTYGSSLASDSQFPLGTLIRFTNTVSSKKSPILLPREIIWLKIPTITHGLHTGLPLAIRTLPELVVVICLITHAQDITFRGLT
jgi:hypothetical protein